MAGIWCAEGRLRRRWVWCEGSPHRAQLSEDKYRTLALDQPFPTPQYKNGSGQREQQVIPRGPWKVHLCAHLVNSTCHTAWMVCFLALAPTKMGGRDCVLFISSPPYLTQSWHPWVNAHIHSPLHVPTFLRVRDMCKGHVPGWAHTHSSPPCAWMHAESTWAVCLWLCEPWVQAGIPVSVSMRTYVCFLPSPISFSTLYISGHRDFSPHRWEVLIMGTKSRHGKSYSLSQESFFFPPLPSSVLSSPLPFLFHIAPLLPPGKLIWAQPLLTWPFGPISCFLMSDCLLGPFPRPSWEGGIN